MPFPTTRIKDNANRDDGPIGDAWVDLGMDDALPLTIAGHHIVAGDGYQGGLLDEVFGPRCEAYVTLADAGLASVFFGMFIRWDKATSSGYALSFTTPDGIATLNLVRYDAGTPTTLDSEAWGTMTNGDALGLSADGDTLRMFLRENDIWSQVMEVTDATYPGAGRIGLHTFDTGGPSIRFEDFGGGTMGVPGNVPVNTAAPHADGIAETGRTLVCDPGLWSGDSTISFDYQWQRSNADIVGEDAATYELASEDVGEVLRCRVTGWNASGIGVAYTQEVRSIASTAGMADTLVAVDGSWVPVKMRVGGQWEA